ncbi:DUF6279 family lipoprotein [Pseudomaricurvus sp. HS19]|uniref:DUF6279 family lipoprotein n=1 Tax=Pseudomaricurvus sp. HS19 TaxID=2692626 RepID=UPI001371D7B0|nr:DUF6279 family lipoprotein [Pseudomaricurvus sp. HS19]MYM64479.1 hypothetical protein [Pseudomaricurvus sp. HS19]
MRYRRWPLLALILLLLAGCSSTTFIYNRLDFFIPWYLGRYVDLNHEQDQHLDELLDPFLVWHRDEELPAYLEWLDRAGEQLKQEITAAQLAELGGEIQQAWGRIESRGLEWMITLGETLSDQQMAEFMAELRQQQVEYAEDFDRNDEDYRENVRENLEGSMEKFLGQLNGAQEQMLDRAVAQLQRSDQVWLAERARWLDLLDRILQRQPGWQDELRHAVATQGEFYSAEYRAVYQYNSEVLYGVIAEVLNSRSDKQERHLQRSLKKLRKDLLALQEK